MAMGPVGAVPFARPGLSLGQPHLRRASAGGDGRLFARHRPLGLVGVVNRQRDRLVGWRAIARRVQRPLGLQRRPLPSS